jgi:hypothetical protein
MQHVPGERNHELSAPASRIEGLAAATFPESFKTERSSTIDSLKAQAWKLALEQVGLRMVIAKRQNCDRSRTGKKKDIPPISPLDPLL